MAANPDQAVQAIRTWKEWMDRYGLKENEAKVSILCPSIEHEQRFIELGVSAAVLQSEITVLGVTFRRQGTPPILPQKRITKAQRLIARIAVLPLGAGKRAQAYRTRVAPYLAWGAWWCDLPAGLTKEWTTKLTAAFKMPKQASRSLWQLGHGHWIDPTFYAAMASLGFFNKAVKYWGQSATNLASSTWWRRCREWINSFEIVHQARGWWQCPSGARVHWKPGAPVAGLQHELREAWRRKRFHTFLQEDRRDARALRDLVVYSAVTQRQTARPFSLATVFERGVMMGAALSTAFYEKVRKCESAPVCVWCGKGEPAHWLHLAWKCDYFACERPPEPSGFLAQRFGWHETGTVAEAKNVLRHLARVRREIRWSHGFRGQRRG